MKKLTYMSLFSGGGIGCYGFLKEGFECVLTNELLEKRLEIQKHNNKCKSKNGYIPGDITNKDVYNKIIQQASLKKIDVLIATPPCQGMSVANHKKKDENTRNSLVVQSLNIISTIKPKYFILENVRSFLTTECTDLDGKNKKISAAIDVNLSGLYNIGKKVINFKDIGVPSSRTRTLVIGVRKDLKNISPDDLFPIEQKKVTTLRKSIGKLRSLSDMGEIDQDDLLHFFREYRPNMRDWIKGISEGESAFDNKADSLKPHKVVDGNIVINQNKNGDKYKRQYWDKVGPCIHTRNDILASQNTLHPKDDRVFSIRELMILMGIPNSFKWFNRPLSELNKLSHLDKKAILKKEELNIRHIIGESVPSLVFQKIAENIKRQETNPILSVKEIKTIITQEELFSNEKILSFLRTNKGYGFTNLSKILEYSNVLKDETAAFYTRNDIIYSTIKDLPDFKKKKSINILEPSVGVGNFLPFLINKYKGIKNVNIDVIDIDKSSIKKLKTLVKETLTIPKNININYINNDFLTFKVDKKYDLVIGNPPYGKIKKGEDNFNMYDIKTNNIFVYFLLKSLQIGTHVSLIIPKSFISSPEYNDVRLFIGENKIHKIIDYGEKAFEGVKIETINLELDNTKFISTDNVLIESYINQTYVTKEGGYIFSNVFPFWLLYRNDFFDSITEKLNFNIFNVFRDRQITKKHCLNQGKLRVIKSRNLDDDGNIIETDKDLFIDDISNFQVSKYVGKENIILVPNLSYYPRAGILPKNTIVDGSLAILEPKDNIDLDKLIYFSTNEFRRFYKIARNHGTRSLNIDNNSIYFFGLPN